MKREYVLCCFGGGVVIDQHNCVCTEKYWSVTSIGSIRLFSSVFRFAVSLSLLLLFSIKSSADNYHTETYIHANTNNNEPLMKRPPKQFVILFVSLRALFLILVVAGQ